MTNLEIEFTINTPLFMRGYTDTPEFRLPSFKGALRFWWRAISFKTYKNDIEKLYDHESKIFGDAQRKGYGRSKVVLSLDEINYNKNKKITNTYQTNDKMGLIYLGYGLYNYRKTGKTGKYHAKPYLTENISGKISLNCKNLDENQYQSLRESIIALGFFGGLGARSRRGFGSFNIINIMENEKTVYEQLKNKRDMIKRIKNFINKNHLPDVYPSYSAISKKSRVDILAESVSSIKVLNEIGEKMIRYRSWGRYGKNILGEIAEQNFKEDHDLMKSYVYGEKSKIQSHPDRIVFGLPQNYYFSKIRKSVSVTPESAERRSSPLLFKVLSLADSQQIGISILLQSQFLPNEEKILLNHNRKKAVKVNIDWKVIDKFLDKRATNIC